MSAESGAPLRTFVALRVGAAAAEPLARLAVRLAREDDALRAVAREDLHLTLHFLGATPPERARNVGAALAAVAARHAPITVRYRGLGAFPDAARASVVWAGVEEERPGALKELARDVGAMLAPLGFPPESRPFAAHVTLARVREGRRVAPATRAALSRAATPAGTDPTACGPDRLSDLAFIVSLTGTGRYAYNDLTRHPLVGPDA